MFNRKIEGKHRMETGHDAKTCTNLTKHDDLAWPGETFNAM